MAVGANNVGDTNKCQRVVAQSRGDHVGIRFTNFGNVKVSHVAVKLAVFALRMASLGFNNSEAVAVLRQPNA